MTNWVKFEGKTNPKQVDGSHVATLTDNGTGDYILNLTDKPFYSPSRIPVVKRNKGNPDA